MKRGEAEARQIMNKEMGPYTMAMGWIWCMRERRESKERAKAEKEVFEKTPLG